MLQTDIRYDTVRNYVELLSNVDENRLNTLFAEMEEESKSVLNEQHIETSQIRFLKSYDIRYVGQEYTVNVISETKDMSELEKLFHDAHLDIYGHNNLENLVEIVNLRLTAYGDLEKLEVNERVNVEKTKVEATHSRECYWDGEKMSTSVYYTEELQKGNYFYGPAIIEDKSSTIVVPPKYKVTVDYYNNIQIEKEINE